MAMMNDPTVPSFMGVPMKHISLLTLCFQNSGLILIMHYSRVMPVAASGRYLTSTAVLLNEIIKLLICAFVAWRDRRKIDGSLSSFSANLRGLYGEVFRADSWKLAIPAALYTLQNSLQYVAVSNLDAATFQVTYQLKIITTALFSVTMLQRKLSLNKWISLLLLTVGIAIVQVQPQVTPPQPPPHHGGGVHRRSSSHAPLGIDTTAEATMDRTLGLAAVIIACTLSGLAGVYFEKVLKGSSTSLWIRNVQLSFYSLFPAFFLGVLLKDGQEIAKKGFFVGYNGVVWTAIGFQAAGGIVVALCVNYADNIAKNFATSISILLSSLASVYFFKFVMTLNFLIGASVVLFATWLYSKPDAPRFDEPDYISLQHTKVDEETGPIPNGGSAYDDGDLGVRSTNPSAHGSKRYD